MKYQNEAQKEKELFDALELIRGTAGLPENLTPWEVAVKVAAMLTGI